MTDEFIREDRYIVFKHSDLEKLPASERHVFSRASRIVHDQMFKAGAPARSFVVVESDWPEYQLVWAMIEHRIAGKPVPNFNDWRREDELQQRLTEADQRIEDLVAQVAKLRPGPCKLIAGDELP